MNIILFDYPEFKQNLLPLTFTRPVAQIRVGIQTIAEKWASRFPNAKISFATDTYLQEKFPLKLEGHNILINASFCPTDELVSAIQEAIVGDKYGYNGIPLFLSLSQSEAETLVANKYSAETKEIEYKGSLISEVWHIFQKNAEEIKSDFSFITTQRSSQKLNDPYTRVYGAENLFIEEGASIRASIIDAENGPVYIGKNAQVHEGSIIKGSFALCEGAHVNMGAKIKGDSTIGPFSKVGGEISNSVIFGYSNKGHDGFLGNSVLGEWCNLGADTNTSNLKNNYASVKLWNYQKRGFKDTGLQFCGLIMGDHAKSGINTMFNTGTVVGVSANVFGDGFPRNFIPSFAWGGAAGFSTFALPKAFEVAEKVMERRSVQFDDLDKKLMQHLFEISAEERNWERK